MATDLDFVQYVGDQAALPGRLGFRKLLLLLCASCAALPAAAETPALSKSHDGTWSVQLTCDDVQTERGLARGYLIAFPVVIQQGQLRGEYRSTSNVEAGELRYTGEVREDGTLRIRAQGRTGKSEYTVGRSPAGTAYGYTLRGTLDATAGEARREQLRPCVATFTRLP